MGRERDQILKVGRQTSRKKARKKVKRKRKREEMVV
jgi:hypothetical protein